MPKTKRTLDTNLFIRYFAENDPKKATAVEKLLKDPRQNLELPDLIIAEIVWVLLSFYKLSKQKVIEKLEGLLSLENVKMNRDVLKQAVKLYRKYNISCTDAYLAAYTLENKMKAIYSFDQGLDKIKEIKRLKP